MTQIHSDISARGKAKPSTAGSITSIANRAAKIASMLEGTTESVEVARDSSDVPVEATVSVESDRGRFLIRQEYGTTIAILN
ncbi:hypothetical protein HDU97_005143 [Phlyctochytrium planicorne]|nr:hypothetical protein HDU97_005143 [Phlyctochytrium planicorne]